MNTANTSDYVIRQYEYTVPVFMLYAIEYGTEGREGFTPEENAQLDAFLASVEAHSKKEGASHYHFAFPDNIDAEKYFSQHNDVTKLATDVVEIKVVMFIDTTKIINTIRDYIIENAPKRSQWNRGVKLYALEFIDDLENYFKYTPENYDAIFLDTRLKTLLLNGARNWLHYSESGCSLAYNVQIAKRLCTPSQLKKNLNGAYNPSKDETWLQVQARALKQAADLVRNAVKELTI